MATARGSRTSYVLYELSLICQVYASLVYSLPMELLLQTPIKDISNIAPIYEKRLERLGIFTLQDLLFHFPRRYEDLSQVTPIASLKADQVVSVHGVIRSIANRRSWKQKRMITDAILEDDTGSISIIWFNQPYLMKSIRAGQEIAIAGKPTITEKGKLVFVSPDFELSRAQRIHTSRIIGIYPETGGVSSKWLRWKIHTFLETLQESLPEDLPSELLSRYVLMDRQEALRQIHFPESLEEAKKARQRFSFAELLKIRLRVLLEKESHKKEISIPIPFDEQFVKDLVNSFDFELTQDQRKATWEIVKDMSRSYPMQRLLEGDVGTGKTLVAFIVSALVGYRGKQAALLAPTEILASQHFSTFTQLLAPFGISVGLCTRAMNKLYDPLVEHVRDITSEQGKEKVQKGEISIIIGTHALLSSKNTKKESRGGLVFKDLALVIIDEQHRFGVDQRSQLLEVSYPRPHFLTMTATPIPRSLALTLYGSLDASRLTTFPLGERNVVTRIVAPLKRTQAYEFIRERIAQGQQLYVICPIIEESETLDSKAAREAYEELRTTIFPEFTCALLHGRMKTKEKEEVMQKFFNREVMILIATSVVEVGVDVPGASMMIIEGAQRFGLAQIHQLRGRIGRRGQVGHCLLFTNSQSEVTAARLNALTMSNDGFVLAQKDLEIRGPGQLMGTRQAGISDVAMEALGNTKLMSSITKEAVDLLRQSPDLSAYPLLAQDVAKLYGFLHME